MANQSSSAQNPGSSDISSSRQSFFLPYAQGRAPTRLSDGDDDGNQDNSPRSFWERQIKLRKEDPSAALSISNLRVREEVREQKQKQKSWRNTPTIMKTRGKRRRVQTNPSTEYQTYNNPNASSADSRLSLSPCTSSLSQRLRMETTPGKFITVTRDATPGLLNKHLPNRNVSKDAPKGPSPIERLPYDILNEIFFHSRNIYFPRSSPIIGMKLSVPSTYNRFCREYLCFQTRGLKPAPQYLASAEHLYQICKNDAEPLPDDEAATDGTLSNDKAVPKKEVLHSMGPAICWHDNPSVTEMTLMIDVALSCRWMTFEYITSIRCQLNDPNRPPLGRKLLLKPVSGCRATPPAGTPWFCHPTRVGRLDLCFAKQIIPRKLLTLPVKPGQMEFLKLMFELGACVNACNSCDGELALDLLRNCALRRDYESMEVLLKPGTNIYPDLTFRRWALEITQCERTMLAFLKRLRLFHGGTKSGDWPKNWPRRSYDWSTQWPEDDTVVCTMLRERYGPDYLLDLEKELKGECNGEDCQTSPYYRHGLSPTGQKEEHCSDGSAKECSKKRKIEEISYDFTDDEFDPNDVLSDDE
ncbi:MAG: hypothetical protein M1831_006320 [Alyxoria varia]|nr:MAG: hypothetical protein M1831_006320 [Alyxoria varia]